MTVIQGDGGGIVGCGVDDSNGLQFRVSAHGTFELMNGQTTLLTSQTSSYIKQETQKNTLFMAVEDKEVYLYVNGKYLGKASDTFTGGGRFGVMGVNTGQATTVKYQNFKIWQW